MKKPQRNARRAANVRTALVLLAIALAFFFGVMVKYRVFGQ